MVIAKKMKGDDKLFGLMEGYKTWVQYAVFGTIGLILLLAIAFVVMTILSKGKHKRIIEEVNKAVRGNIKVNRKIGFYPPEDQGSFGQESFKTTFDDDGEVDMSAFTLSSAEKQQFPQEQVVEHQAQDSQVKDFNTVSGSMVGYQHQTSFAAAQPLQSQTPGQPVQQAPAAPMQQGFAQAPVQGAPGQVQPAYAQPPMQQPPAGQAQPAYAQPPMQAPPGQAQPGMVQPPQ